MLFLLPPSESKRAGGDPERVLDLAALSRPGLAAPRRRALARLRELSSDLDRAASALGLGPRSRAEAALNREVRRGPTLPAIDRFDGVLYDALGATSLGDSARRWVEEHVAIASALFGLLAPSDPIPAYRLSAATRLPGTSLAAIWRDPIRRALETERGPILDLRSEAYAALGPAPDGSPFVRIVRDEEGRRRALNHTGKAAKGELIRALAEDGPELGSVDDLVHWGGAHGMRMERAGDRELRLVVG